MENRNGYFQVMRSEKGIFVKLVPERGTGKKVDINDIREYLEYHKITDCNFVELGKVINSLNKEETVFVSHYVGYPINEYMKITVSSDGMVAKVRFYPPSNDGKRISEEEIKSDLSVAGVVYGIDERVIKYQLTTPLYCTDFIIAKGKKVVEGCDATIEYLFNTDRHVHPKRNEDGTVNFHQLNNISHIKAGDVLAILHPENVGENGINVRGIEVRPRPVARKKLKYGKNIELSDDNLKIISKVNGHAILEGERVFVSDVYDVAGDVDNSTGDIDYEGNVLVHGNVRTGFKIKAVGDIEVMGSVEGAELIAGGNIVLRHGMQGMTKGKIVSRGNVISKFIESARVFAEGYIETEAIIQSQVSSKGDVNVNGQKGHIIGGYIRSASNIEAKIIGSGMGITTIVEVGFDPETQDRINKLKTDIADKNVEYKKCTQMVEVLNKRLTSGNINIEQKLALKENLQNLTKLKDEMFNAQDELDELTAKVYNNNASFIKVRGDIFPGTQVRISGEYYNVNEEISYCKFYKVNGEIRTGAI